MRQRRFSYYLFAFVIVSLLVMPAGCGNTGSTQATPAPTSVPQATEAVATATSQPERTAADPTQESTAIGPTSVPQSAGAAALPAKFQAMPGYTKNCLRRSFG